MAAIYCAKPDYRNVEMPDDLSVVNETPDKLVDAAFVMAESGDIPSAIRIMEAACRLDDANK